VFCNKIKDYIGYTLKKPTGLYESFEREYFDMVRSAFLKFSFQARIGRMDGIMVAFHNTFEIFGFQYIPLSEMDFCVFGNTPFAEASFKLSVTILEDILNTITKRFPDRVCVTPCGKLQTLANHLHLLIGCSVHLLYPTQYHPFRLG